MSDFSKQLTFLEIYIATSD